MNRIVKVSFFLAILCWVGCRSSESKEVQNVQPVKIASLNGAVSEILVQLGLEENLVGVDVTSTYPSSLSELPQLGHPRNLSVEGLVSILPHRVLAIEGSLDPDKVNQIKEAGIQLDFFEHEQSVDGVYRLIDEIAQLFDKAKPATKLKERIKNEMEALDQNQGFGKVLFIYARGSGNLMVAGTDTPADAFIELAGGSNAATGFDGFKPLTAEAVLLADPEIFLLFESGLSSLEGMDGLLAIPGVAETQAGKNKSIVTMDGQLMLGFGPRLPQALAEFKDKATAFANP